MLECWKRGLIWRGITHDLSKLLPSEFVPYARYFYGDYPEWATMLSGQKEVYFGKTKESIMKDFDFAWLLHQKRNPHHWQWWILREDDGGGKTFEMDDNSRTEMLADWIGAGKAITGKDNLAEWYDKNKDKMLLHPKTRKAVEAEMKPKPTKSQLYRLADKVRRA